MVKFFLYFTLLLSNSLFAASLKLDLNNHRVEMGKSLLATFTYQGSSKPEALDLTSWEDDFFIVQSDADHTNNEFNGINSITQARLYPRHVGTVTLDAIALGGSFVKPRTIEVKPSIRNNVNATPNIKALANHYWADEAIRVQVDVPLHYQRNEVVAKEWLVDGFTIYALPSVKTKQQISLNWLIYTPFKGIYNLELPAIIQRGRGRFRFHSPKLNVTIKPLPSYLPSSIPSGLVDISSSIQQKNQLTVATITLQKMGYLPKHIEGFQTFIEQLSNDELSLNISQKQTIKNGLTTRQYQITLPSWLWRKQLTLNLLAFNTATGLLEKQRHKLPVVSTLPKYVDQAFIFLCLIIGFMTLRKINTLTSQWRSKRALIGKIKQAKTATEIRGILLGTGNYKTLSNWSAHINNTLSIEISAALNQACFQKNRSLMMQSNWLELQHKTLRCIKYLPFSVKKD